MPDGMRRARTGDMLLTAARIDAEAAESGQQSCAAKYAGDARAALPEALLSIGPGGELVPPDAPFRSTLENPDYVAADASRDRLDLAHQAGCLELALDAADTAKSRNSIEAMMAHQMAAAHRAGMKIMGYLNTHVASLEAIDPQRLDMMTVIIQRLANSAGRLMAGYQSGALTLAQLRRGGRQTVVVKHQQVVVKDSAQAVIAGDDVSGGRGKTTKRDARGRKGK